MIQIDIPMPKSCDECPFRVWLQDVDSYECACNGNNVYVVEKGKKHEECPLKNVEVKKEERVEMTPDIVMDLNRNELWALCDDCENACICKHYKTIAIQDQPKIKWCSGYKEENGEWK